ncbi:GrpB family protein [Halobaculum litoreum]|uniref:GrpB family protein n=1 Tax=Halobaculum litoreum TaxID=3031998 RepID=A0ABD5XUB4_9EURY|nr:GrpB family protein [Halobaculum sp. DT92]
MSELRCTAYPTSVDHNSHIVSLTFPTVADYHTPIEVWGYRDAWADRFDAERDRLVDAFDDGVVAVEHIGSTSVPGLAAKPIVDICPVVPDMETAERQRSALESLGYEFNARREDWLAFERYDPDLPQQYNLHFHPTGSERLRRVLTFRDYLRDHDHARRAYESAKRHAAAAHPNDPSAYNDAKDDIAECLIVAAREAGYEPSFGSA